MLLPSFDLQGKGWLECRLLDQLFYPPAAPSSLPPCRRQKACLVPARCDLPSQCEHSVAHLPSGVPFDSGKEWSTRRCGRVFTALCQTAEAGLNKLFHPRLRLHDSLEKAHFGPRNRGHQSLEWEEGAHHSTVWGAFGGNAPYLYCIGGYAAIPACPNAQNCTLGKINLVAYAWGLIKGQLSVGTRRFGELTTYLPQSVVKGSWFQLFKCKASASMMHFYVACLLQMQCLYGKY